MIEAPVIRWHLHELLVKRGWTAYRLATEADITVPAAYRLARPGKTLQRLDVDTLERLCRVLKVKPGQLLTYEPD